MISDTNVPALKKIGVAGAILVCSVALGIVVGNRPGLETKIESDHSVATPIVSVTNTPSRAPIQTPSTGKKIPTATITNKPLSAVSSGAIVVTVKKKNGDVLAGAGVQIESEKGEKQESKTDEKGVVTFPNVSAGSYRVWAYFDKWGNSEKASISAGKTLSVGITLEVVDPPQDTTAPVLHRIRGPYDGGEGRICLAIVDYDEQNGYHASWKLDDDAWAAYSSTEGTFCYTNLSGGEHSFSAKLKDDAGNEGNTVTNTFQVPIQ